jgi:long-chain acyl-CoA synthetase
MMKRYTYRKPDNLVDLFESAVERFGSNKLFGSKSADGQSLRWSSYREIGRRVDNLRAGLATLGVDAGDAVGLIANNRPEWAVAAFATYGRGAWFVPMYEAELTKTWHYIIADSRVKVLFVSTREVYEKVKVFPKEIKTLEKIILIDGEGEESMSALEKLGSASPIASTAPSAYDIAVLIYTSGTTGEPKGVLLSHGNLTQCAWSGYALFPELDEGARSLSILPWAHSYGQSAELNNWLQFGGSIGFMESVDTLADDLALVKPTFLIAVPRVFNKIYGALWEKMRKEGGLKLALFQAAVDTARTHRELEERGKSSLLVTLKLKVLDKLVFSKIRARFGGRLKGALTASATMNTEIAHFFFDIGIPVYDCYGLTETSPAVSMNCPSAYRLGSVGKLVDQVEVVIDNSLVEPDAKDGEIIVYGPIVMQGYHNKPEATKAVMTDDGGFRTGDRGRMDEEGYLYITGRIKEQFKLENGKYVFPAEIEEDLKLLPFVENAMIFGEGKPHILCLIYPNTDYVQELMKENGIKGDIKHINENPEIERLLSDQINSALRGKFGGYEIPKKFIYLEEDFTLENGMLTQTMKLKRRVVVDRYKGEIEDKYLKK